MRFIGLSETGWPKKRIDLNKTVVNESILVLDLTKQFKSVGIKIEILTRLTKCAS
jgi:hypothetical protein